MKVFTIILAAAVLLAADTAPVLLEAAKKKEVVDGDLRGAIKQYGEIASRFAKTDRAAAATALIRMAECHSKLGDAEGRKIYERIVREFGDQKDAVTTARARLGAAAQTAGIVHRKVWTLPAQGDLYSSVSRDGRFVPYVDWKDYGNLHLHDLVTGADRRVTDNGTDGKSGVTKSQEQYADQHAFSRDGKHIAYAWLSGDHWDLRVANLDRPGLPESRKLFDNPEYRWIGPLDWSPDGQWIAVELTRIDRSWQLGLLSVKDGSVRVLKSLDWRDPGNGLFSADGKFLAYDLPTAEKGRQRDVFVIAVDGSREIPAAVHPSHDALVGWSPDGKRLLFGSDRSGTMGLWSVPFSGGAITGQPELLKADLGHVSSLGVASSGTLHLDSGQPQGADLQIAPFDFETGAFLSPPASALPTFVRSNQLPDWSRDAKYLAFASRRDALGMKYFLIGIRSTETGQIREVVPTPNFELFWNLTWSADGKSFLVGGRDTRGRNGIFRVDGQTGQSTMIVQRPQAPRVAVESPDGKNLYYADQVADGTAVAFMKRELTSGEESVLLQRSQAGPPVFRLSPDGRFLVIPDATLRRLPQALTAIATTGGEPRDLIRVSGQAMAIFVGFTPDGKSALIRKVLSPGNEEYLRVPLADGTPVTREMKSQLPRLFLVSPDGKQVVLMEPTPQKPQEVWALENFLPPSR